MLTQIQDFTARPDIADDCFLLASRCIRYCPQLFFPSPVFPPLVDCSMVGVTVQHRCKLTLSLALSHECVQSTKYKHAQMHYFNFSFDSLHGLKYCLLPDPMWFWAFLVGHLSVYSTKHKHAQTLFWISVMILCKYCNLTWCFFDCGHFKLVISYPSLLESESDAANCWKLWCFQHLLPDHNYVLARLDCVLISVKFSNLAFDSPPHPPTHTHTRRNTVKNSFVSCILFPFFSLRERRRRMSVQVQRRILGSHPHDLTRLDILRSPFTCHYKIC